MFKHKTLPKTVSRYQNEPEIFKTVKCLFFFIISAMASKPSLPIWLSAIESFSMDESFSDSSQASSLAPSSPMSLPSRIRR
jgi:hypothetical protein